MSSLDNISVVFVPQPKIFFMYFAAGAATINHHGIKTPLANGLITFSIKGNPVFSSGPRSLSRNPSDYVILDN